MLQDLGRSARLNDAQPPAADDEIDLVALMGALWRGKWIISLCALIACVLGAYYAFGIAVPRFEATTTLATQERSQNIFDIESVVSGISTDNASLNTEIEVMRSRRLLEKLVIDLNLESDPEFNATLRQSPSGSLADFVGAMRAWLRTNLLQSPPTRTPSPNEKRYAVVDALLDVVSASNQRNTYVFHIAARTEAPEKSAAISNRLAEIYIADQVTQKLEATESAVAWLTERATELEGELANQEDAIKQFLASTELVDDATLALLTRRAKENRDRVENASNAARAAEARQAELVRLAATGSPSALADTLADPVLVELAKRLDAGDDDARQAFDARASRLLRQSDIDANRAIQQATALQLSLADLEAQIARQSEDLLTLEQMRREAQATSTLYENVLTRLKEIAVQSGLQQADSRILSFATPGKLVEPRKSRILALSVVLGSMIGVGIVLARQMLHSRCVDADEIEAMTGLPVLGQTPTLPMRKRAQLVDYLASNPTSAAAEAFRNLRTSILLSDLDTPPKVIMLTSSVPGEGKTTNAVALAQNYAGLGKKVLLLEGDMRRRTLGAYFSAPPKGGVMAALMAEVPVEDLVLHDPRLGVDILLAQKARSNAADILSSDRFREFVAHMRERYDTIIIDTPPVLAVPDARIVGQVADTILYTVKWDATHKSQLLDGLRQFEIANLRVAGLVFSQVDGRKMARYGYGNRYGAYRTYGKGYYDI